MYACKNSKTQGLEGNLKHEQTFENRPYPPRFRNGSLKPKSGLGWPFDPQPHCQRKPRTTTELVAEHPGSLVNPLGLMKPTQAAENNIRGEAVDEPPERLFRPARPCTRALPWPLRAHGLGRDSPRHSATSALFCPRRTKGP